jgi:hypothetical protein
MQLLGRRFCNAEVSYEKLIGYTVGIDIVNGGGRESLCFEITVDCETSMVKIP